MGWDAVLPVVTLVIGYFADVGKMSLTGRAERKRRAADDQRATLLAFQEALLELVPIAQDSCAERRDRDNKLTVETHRALYQAHLKAEALRVRLADDRLRSGADDWVKNVYEYGASTAADGDFDGFITDFAELNERIGELLRQSTV